MKINSRLIQELLVRFSDDFFRDISNPKCITRGKVTKVTTQQIDQKVSQKKMTQKVNLKHHLINHHKLKCHY